MLVTLMLVAHPGTLGGVVSLHQTEAMMALLILSSTVEDKQKKNVIVGKLIVSKLTDTVQWILHKYIQVMSIIYIHGKYLDIMSKHWKTSFIIRLNSILLIILFTYHMMHTISLYNNNYTVSPLNVQYLNLYLLSHLHCLYLF